jgi:CxxC-x17-CxxC domain-containing protein
MQPDPRRHARDPEGDGSLRWRQAVNGHELEEAPIAFGQFLERQIYGPGFGRRVDAAFEAFDVVVGKQISAGEAAFNLGGSPATPQLVRRNVVDDAVEPGHRASTPGIEPGRRLEEGEEHGGREVGHVFRLTEASGSGRYDSPDVSPVELRQGTGPGRNRDEEFLVGAWIVALVRSFVQVQRCLLLGGVTRVLARARRLLLLTWAGAGLGSRASGQGGCVTPGTFRDRNRHELSVRRRHRRDGCAATCSSCGREAQVPFRPTGSKPVYCSDCLTNQRASSNRY